MNQIWSLTIDDYLAVVEIAKKAGVQPGESLEKHLVEYMTAKGAKPIGVTELNHEELLREHASKGAKVLDIKHDTNGNPEYRITKPKED